MSTQGRAKEIVHSWRLVRKGCRGSSFAMLYAFTNCLCPGFSLRTGSQLCFMLETMENNRTSVSQWMLGSGKPGSVKRCAVAKEEGRSVGWVGTEGRMCLYDTALHTSTCGHLASCLRDSSPISSLSRSPLKGVGGPPVGTGNELHGNRGGLQTSCF